MKTLRYEKETPMRLDRFLQQQLPGLPLSLLHKYLRQNKIKLNGKKQPLDTRLCTGDEVRLYLPETEPAAAPLTVLYEDDQLLAVDKPAGLISMEAPGQPVGDSLLARARRYMGARPSDAFPALCHRLDTGTSGVLLLAKTPAMLDYVTGLIREKRLAKTYYGVVVGHPVPAADSLAGFLAKDAEKGTVRILLRPGGGAKPVQTDYETIATSGRLALLRLCPRTGRTHQLRAHMAMLGTPLLGDSKYGTLAANRQLRCRYQCLCAGKVTFPRTGDASFAPYSGLSIQCEKPWYFEQMLNGTLFY